MGRRGPAPKPAAVNAARGNPGHRKAKAPSPQPTALADLKAPAWLHALARAEWKRLAGELARLGRLTVADASSFAGYCQAYARWRTATAAVQRQTSLALAIAQGLVNAEKAALAQMERLGAQFGLTPASRDRMTAGAGQQEEADPFAEFEQKGPRGIVGGRA